MTRETKIGLLVGLAFIIVIGIMLSDLNSTNNQKLPAPLQMAGSTLRTGLGQPVTDDVSPITVVPQNITPHPINIAPPEQPLALKPEPPANVPSNLGNVARQHGEEVVNVDPPSDNDNRQQEKPVVPPGCIREQNLSGSTG